MAGKRRTAAQIMQDLKKRPIPVGAIGNGGRPSLKTKKISLAPNPMDKKV